MRVSFITIFPEMILQHLKYGVIGRAVNQGAVDLHIYNPRDYASNVNGNVDDKPFGGGPGMVMMAEPMFKALDKATDSKYAQSKIKGEIKIRENFDRATIIKPSIVFSVDDKFTTKFMSLLSLLPIFPLYYNGETKFTPIHAADVAELIFNVISKEIVSKDIEAVGPEVLTFKEIIQPVAQWEEWEKRKKSREPSFFFCRLLRVT